VAFCLDAITKRTELRDSLGLVAAFVWSDFNVVAATLAISTDEAALRSAISRAYYAVFGSARAQALTESYSLPRDGGSAHKSLWDYYRDSTDLARRAFGIDGGRLHIERLRADYDNPMRSPVAPAAQQAVSEAARLLGVLPNL
jgi:uncharacterized protein (UPF0332 family)